MMIDAWIGQIEMLKVFLTVKQSLKQSRNLLILKLNLKTDVTGNKVKIGRNIFIQFSLSYFHLSSNYKLFKKTK